MLRLKISDLIKPSRLSMLPPGPVLHVVIRAQKRHQAGTAWRRQTDRRTVAVTLKSVDLHVLTFFASNAVVNSTQSGGVLDGERSYKVKWPRPDPEGEVDRDSAFSWLAELYYMCTLYGVFYSVYVVPTFPRTPLHPAFCASSCSLWENCRK